MSDALLELHNIKKYFLSGPDKIIKAVDGVSLSVKQGETLGLVGESGCGKTTLARIIMRLYKPAEGQIFYRGTDITRLNKADSFSLCRDIQMIFQDPYASLNPRMTIEDIIGEPLDIHQLTRGNRRKEKIHELLLMVGLDPLDSLKFPHELSGGQKQRVGIARALAVNPSFVVLDEPVSALDVSIQAQIINLLVKLQKERNLTSLFISHDLAMVEHVSRRIAVMYMGNIVEIADSEELYNNAQHPYTKELFLSIPVPDPELEKSRQPAKMKYADRDNPRQNDGGCVFVSKCPCVYDTCFRERPSLRPTHNNHLTACHLINI